VKKISWPTIKSILDLKLNLSPQYIELPKKYIIELFDGPSSYKCVIFKKSIPSADQTDWETNYKSRGNNPLSNVDSEGVSLYSPKMAPDGWVLQGLCFDFTLSKLNSLNMLNDDGTVYPHGSMLFYDANGVPLTTQASIDSSCVKTIVVFNPDHDYGIIKGKIYVPTIPLFDIRMFTIIAPDIPKAMGGNVNLLKNLNLRCVSGSYDQLEAYAARFITYDPVNFSSKIHFVFNHPVGHQHELMMKVEYYEP